MQPPDEVDFSQEGKKGKLGMASRSEEHRRPDCHGSILMPLPQALDHVSFLFSAPVSPRTSAQMVSGSLLLRPYNATRQRQEMSKKGQDSREPGEQGAGSCRRAGSRAEKEPRVRKSSQTAYTHDTSSQGPTEQQSPCPALPSPRVRSGCPFQKPPTVFSAKWEEAALLDQQGFPLQNRLGEIVTILPHGGLCQPRVGWGRGRGSPVSSGALLGPQPDS